MKAKISATAVLFLIFVLHFFVLHFTSKSYAAANELGEIKNAISGKNSKWTANETSVSRLAPDERKKLLGTIIPPKGTEKVLTVPSAALPSKLDWRNYAGYNYITPVKEQGSCAACWAFAPAAALESSILISQNIPLNTSEITFDLSEQTAISCSDAGTCRGGSIDYVSDFIRDIGLPEEICYPYTALDGYCSNTCSNWTYYTYKVSDWYRVEPNLDAIKYAIYNKGPVVATMAVYTDFLYYRSVVYSYVWGNLEGYHSALIVGYDDVEQYFIVKSSWGIDWGESGYFRISYGELSSNVSFGEWTIAYDYPIPADFPTIDNVQRVSIVDTNRLAAGGGADRNKGNSANNGQSAQVSVVLKGAVRNAADVPVAGVNVRVGAYSATTNANGGYSIRAIPSGEYMAVLRKNGYSTTIINIILPGTKVVTKNFIINQSAAGNSGNQSASQDSSTQTQPKAANQSNKPGDTQNSGAKTQPKIAGPG